VDNFVSWEAPTLGWTILNTDGASKVNPGLSGGGGVLQGHRGEWICSFIENMGVCTSMKAELKAVFRVLKIAKERNIEKL